MRYKQYLPMTTPLLG